MNIEVDVIAKHLERLAAPYLAAVAPTGDTGDDREAEPRAGRPFATSQGGVSTAVSAVEHDLAAPMVSIRTVSKTFTRRGGATVALRDVNLTVADGEFVSLLGPSGCGKSTLLRVIGGLHRRPIAAR